MVKINWISLVTPSSRFTANIIQRIYFFWFLLIYKWVYRVVKPLRFNYRVFNKMWTILSSPKCHKIGRYQLAHRYARYQFTFKFIDDAFYEYTLYDIFYIFTFLQRYQVFNTHNLISMISFSLYLRCRLLI
jgi:hypothetical protein